MLIRGKTVYVYDIEIFPNVFHCTVKNSETGEYLYFEICGNDICMPAAILSKQNDNL